MSKSLLSVAVLATTLSAAVPASGQEAAMSRQAVSLQRLESATQMNTDEMRLTRMEARLKRLEAENEELRQQLSQLDDRSRRFVSMPEGCRAGFSNGATVGTAEGFHRNLFPYLTCQTGGQ